MIYPLLILSILIWPFGQLLNFQVGNLPFTFYPLDIISGLITIALLLSAKSRQVVLQDPLVKPLAIFLLAATASLLINLPSRGGDLTYPLFYLARLFIYPSIFFAVKQFSAKKITPYLLLSLAAFSFIGLAQYLFLPDVRFLKYLGYDDHYYRLIGSLYDPNFSGAIFSASALAFLAGGLWPVAIPLVFLLALTFSRASFLVFVAGLVYMAIVSKQSNMQKNDNLSSSRMRGSIWTILACLALLIIALVFIPKPFGEGVNLFRTVSIFTRFVSWENGLNLFFQKPIFGWGYNTLRSINGERFQIDNSYLYIAATTGIFGLLSLFNLLWSALKQVKHFPLKLFLLALLGHSLFNNSLFYIWIYFAFWGILALSTKEYKEP